MKISILSAIGSVFLLVAAQCPAVEDNADKTITKTFNVEPGGELNVEADQGDIDILTGDQSTVQVIVEREVIGGSAGQAEKLLKGHKVTFTQDGNIIHVEAKSLKPPRGHSHPNLEVHFRITVPKRFSANLTTAGGNVKVTGLRGSVDARTSGGNMVFSKIQGAVEANTSGGNVRAADCTDKLQIQSSGGNMVLKDFSGPSAAVDTSGGNIEVSGCTGMLEVKTSGGNISVDGFSGATAYADTSGGAVSVSLDKQPSGNCTFRTSGGNIVVKVPENIAVNLTAGTDGGTVSSDLPVTVQGKIKEGSLEGKINGGGPVMSLRTSGGDIKLLKRQGN